MAWIGHWDWKLDDREPMMGQSYLNSNPQPYRMPMAPFPPAGSMPPVGNMPPGAPGQAPPLLTELFPTPPEMLMGAGVGLVLGNSLKWLSSEKQMLGVAKALDKPFGYSGISDFLKKIHLPQSMQNWPMVRELGMHLETPGRNAPFAKTPADSMAMMEKRHLEATMKPYFKLQEALRKPEKKFWQSQARFDASVLEKKAQLAGLTRAIEGHADYPGLKSYTNFSDLVKNTGTLYEKINENGKGIETRVNPHLEKRQQALSALIKESHTLPPQDFKAQKTALETEVKVLKSVHDYVEGKESFYKPMYEGSAKLHHMLREAEIGPVGKAYASSVYYLTRIFGGDAMQMNHFFGKSAATTAEAAAIKGAGFLKNIRFLGPMAAGALIIGASFHKAAQAKDGEKTQSFFHDFFGAGIANFVGWELGRRILAPSRIVEWGLGRFGQRTNPLKFMTYLPFIGHRFSNKVASLTGMGAESTLAKVLGNHTLGRWFGKVTLTGFAGEMIPLLVFGTLFQKVGERIAHKIFGKPSEEKAEDAKKQQADALKKQQQAQMMAQFQAMRQGQAVPGQPMAFNPSTPFGQSALPAQQPAAFYPQPMPATAYAPMQQQPAAMPFNPYATAPTPMMAPSPFVQAPQGYPTMVASGYAPAPVFLGWNPPAGVQTTSDVRQTPLWQQSDAFLKTIQQQYGAG